MSMKDRLKELLEEHDHLYGVICRDTTIVELELMAQAGYHVVWLDLEHGTQSNTEAIRVSRTITHLGMVPMVRMPELSRSHVQVLADGGIQILNLPDVRTPEQAETFVHLGKYPPVGGRGVCSSSVNFDYHLADPVQDLVDSNDATRLMVMIESDPGYEALDSILSVDGIDMLTIGPADWAASSGLDSVTAKAQLAPKIEHVLEAAAQAGKITAMGAFDPNSVSRYLELGVRIIFVGVDVNMKRKMLIDTLGRFHDEEG